MDHAQNIIKKLGLEPHPEEGGFFRETYRSKTVLEGRDELSAYSGPRCLYTAIYYMLIPGTMSAMHRVASDEVFHFYKGDPVCMLQLFPDGTSATFVLGPDVEAGQCPQLLVPAGVWQGTYLPEGGKFALMGATVSPGFEYADYTNGVFEKLSFQYPDRTDLLKRLCIC